MTITGDVVLDIVQHFVERWNEVKKRKVWVKFILFGWLRLTGLSFGTVSD